ncbi:hypothetical protein JXA32_17535 [Candidatus Sumerlaeota bacterium]|nr:hypothetical protein [Candidatus Sumerlaeota bacterium]
MARFNDLHFLLSEVIPRGVLRGWPVLLLLLCIGSPLLRAQDDSPRSETIKDAIEQPKQTAQESSKRENAKEQTAPPGGEELKYDTTSWVCLAFALCFPLGGLVFFIVKIAAQLKKQREEEKQFENSMAAQGYHAKRGPELGPAWEQVEEQEAGSPHVAVSESALASDEGGGAAQDAAHSTDDDDTTEGFIIRDAAASDAPDGLLRRLQEAGLFVASEGEVPVHVERRAPMIRLKDGRKALLFHGIPPAEVFDRQFSRVEVIIVELDNGRTLMIEQLGAWIARDF